MYMTIIRLVVDKEIAIFLFLKLSPRLYDIHKSFSLLFGYPGNEVESQNMAISSKFEPVSFS